MARGKATQIAITPTTGSSDDTIPVASSDPPVHTSPIKRKRSSSNALSPASPKRLRQNGVSQSCGEAKRSIIARCPSPDASTMKKKGLKKPSNKPVNGSFMLLTVFPSVGLYVEIHSKV